MVTARFFASNQTGPGVHPASCTMGTGSPSRGSSGRACRWPPPSNVAPRLKKDCIFTSAPPLDLNGLCYLYIYIYIYICVCVCVCVCVYVCQGLVSGFSLKRICNLFATGALVSLRYSYHARLPLLTINLNVSVHHLPPNSTLRLSIAVFLNRRAAALCRALAWIIPGRERFLLELITNLNVILYLSTCHTVHIFVLILFMIMP